MGVGEKVVVLGAAGVTGKLAIQTAKLLGAIRVIAGGRNEKILSTLPDLGADATICLDQPRENLIADFSRESGDAGFDIILDYVWGAPTEALLAAITPKDIKPASARSPLRQIGELADPSISSPSPVFLPSLLSPPCP